MKTETLIRCDQPYPPSRGGGNPWSRSGGRFSWYVGGARLKIFGSVPHLQGRGQPGAAYFSDGEPS